MIIGNEKSAGGLLPTTSASLKLYRKKTGSFNTHTERVESHLTLVLEFVSKLTLFVCLKAFSIGAVYFFPLEPGRSLRVCRADLISIENHHAVAEGVLSWRSLFSCAHMCSPYGRALNVPLPFANWPGIPGSLTVHCVKMLRVPLRLPSITVCLSKQTLTQEVMGARAAYSQNLHAEKRGEVQMEGGTFRYLCTLIVQTQKN